MTNPTKRDIHRPDDIGLDLLALDQHQRDELAKLACTYVSKRESGSAGPLLHGHYNALRKAVVKVGGES